MDTESKVLGKLNKKQCYLNHGKYGYYLTLDSKNYKVPEWFSIDKMDIKIAENLIEYKLKMSEQWLETKPNKKNVAATAPKNESDSDDDDDDK